MFLHCDHQALKARTATSDAAAPLKSMGVSSTTPGVSKLDAPVLYSHRYKTKRRNSFWAVAPLLFVVTVLTPATTWMEGFTNHLIAKDYTQDISGWQCLYNKAVLSMPNGLPARLVTSSWLSTQSGVVPAWRCLLWLLCPEPGPSRRR